MEIANEGPIAGPAGTFMARTRQHFVCHISVLTLSIVMTIVQQFADNLMVFVWVNQVWTGAIRQYTFGSILATTLAQGNLVAK